MPFCIIFFFREVEILQQKVQPNRLDFLVCFLVLFFLIFWLDF